MFIYTYRVVSLDFEANMSSEVEILCHKADCGLVNPISMAVVKDQMYILLDGGGVLLLEGKVGASERGSVCPFSLENFPRKTKLYIHLTIK